MVLFSLTLRVLILSRVPQTFSISSPLPSPKYLDLVLFSHLSTIATTTPTFSTSPSAPPTPLVETLIRGCHPLPHRRHLRRLHEGPRCHRPHHHHGPGHPLQRGRRPPGLVPLQAPLQQRLPVADASLDLVRLGRAVSRCIPPELPFLFLVLLNWRWLQSLEICSLRFSASDPPSLIRKLSSDPPIAQSCLANKGVFLQWRRRLVKARNLHLP